MLIRQATLDDKQCILKSFRQLYADWDYLPLVIDQWMGNETRQITWLACDGHDKDQLVAMAQVYEIEPGDWYLRCLRSNPAASYYQNANAVMGIARAIEKEVRALDAKQVRFGTIDYFEESLRLSEMLKFREYFRLAHAFHQPLAEPIESDTQLIVSIPQNSNEIYNFINDLLVTVHGYFFTWWDTRLLREQHVADAKTNNLLFEVRKGNHLDGVMMLYHVPWQSHLVISIMEGSTDTLIALFNAAMIRANELQCDSFGIVHQSHDEMYHRQNLFGLRQHGSYTVQLIRDD